MNNREDDVFLWETSRYLSRTMPDLISSAWLPTACLRRKSVCVLGWPACSPDLSPVEKVWSITERGIGQQQPRTVEQPKSCIQQESTKILLKTCNNQYLQYLSWLKCNQEVYVRKWDNVSTLIFQNIMKLVSENHPTCTCEYKITV